MMGANVGKAERAALNDNLPASESVAAPALSGVDYDALANVYGAVDDPKVSVGYLHLTNPETGQEVVFVPGEALPGWAREAQKTMLQPYSSPAKQPMKGKGQRSVKTQMGENET